MKKSNGLVFFDMNKIFCFTVPKEQTGGLGGFSPLPQFLAKQLTISQPGGQIIPTTVLRAPRNFRPCDGPGIPTSYLTFT